VDSENGAAYIRRSPIRRVLHVVVPPAARRNLWLKLSRAGRLADVYMFLDPGVRSRRVTKKTELVIDGVARSSNSYAGAVLIHLHGEELRFAHHLHTPRAIERGVALGRPTIVLIREPRAVVASLLQYTPAPVSFFVDFYLGYYERVEPFLADVVLADFTEVINDFGAVIARCNDKFGTDLTVYDRTDEDEAVVRELIDMWSAQAAKPEELEMKAPRPSDQRKPAEAMLADLSPEDQKSLARAEALYTRIWATYNTHQHPPTPTAGRRHRGVRR